MQNRIIGIDYGKKRIGLASADLTLGVASPLSTLRTSRGHLETVLELLAFVKSQSIHIEKIVIGLPLQLSGNEGDMSRLVRQFGLILQDRSEKEVIFYDERLTSSEVERLMKSDDISRKRRKEFTDTLAATLLLQTYLQSVIK